MEVYTTRAKFREYIVVVSENQGKAKIISAAYASGKGHLELKEMDSEYLKKHHFKEPAFPVDKALEIILNRAKSLGATQEVMDIVCKHIKVGPRVKEKCIELSRMVKQKDDWPAEEIGEAPKKTKATKAKVPTAKPSTKASKVSGNYSSASAMFQGLIMDGKLTDAEIFRQVQDSFGLADNKSGYVKWYRNHLKKQGKNPPEAK